MSTLFVDTINEKTTNNGVYIPGHVVQAKTATKTDTQSTTSTSFTDITGLSVSITPSSTNSKILVLCTVCISSTFYWCPVRVLRGSTQINAPDAGGSDQILVNGCQTTQTSGAYMLMTVPITVLDSPSSTSALTYKAQFAVLYATGETGFVNKTSRDGNYAGGYDPRGSSSISVLEVGS